MLTSIVVYLYTVLAFNFFRKFYVQEEEGEEPDSKCHDMLSVSRHLQMLIKVSKWHKNKHTWIDVV